MQKILKSAQEPAILSTRRGSEYRTNENWVQLIQNDKGYEVVWGDARGSNGSRETTDISIAESEYERHLTDEMEED